MSHNEVNHSTADAVVQVGAVHGDVHLHPRGSVVRSAYLEQVARIAPPELRDRDGELAELGEWCAADDGQAYRWLRAPAWAGKSALMSWFVLHPPAGVRVVSFFITARLSGQSDKTAFAEVVIEQLAELSQEPLPQLLTDSTRDAHLLGLLSQAAGVCRKRGERLVLVVDGLDEDRGVTVGSGGHSIAALLPAAPVAGLRVVVSGRPDPPMPADVPAHHPLRDPRIVRVLARSAHAEVARADAQRELAHLLRGNATEQELLGLVASAGGGLSGPDLAELTGRPAWEIEEQLGAVSGRTFSRRSGHWGAVSAPHIYLLAHEQLQQDAIRMLGPARVAGFRQRLHDWADGYRAAGWPSGTPEYLMLGYFRLLRETGEVDRLARCALDRTRHERMSDLTGGDSAALTEVATTQDVLHARDDPDLLAVLRLAVYRGELVERNLLVPAGLPQAWARLGHHARAEALARSLPNPVEQARALLAISQAVAATGDLVRAAAIAESAAVSRSDTSTAEHLSRRDSSGLTRYAETARKDNRTDPDQIVAAIDEGNLDQADRLASSIRRRTERSRAMVVVVRAMVRAGRLTRAEEIAHDITHLRHRAKALTELVVPIADLGDTARAEALATEADRTARLGQVRTRPEVVTAVFKAVAVAGDVDTAEALARSLTSSRQQARALAELVAVVAGGDPDRAAALTGTIEDPYWRAQATLDLRRAAGDVGTATAEIAVLIRAIPYSREQATAWSALSTALADSGDLRRAETVARSIDNVQWQGHALEHLVRVLAGHGDLDRATGLAETIVDPDCRNRALVVVATASGVTARARSIGDPRARARALATLAASAGSTGDPVTVAELIEAAEAVDYTAQRAQASSEAVAAIAAMGDLDQAERVARAIALPPWRAHALAELVPVVAARSGLARARALADSIGDHDARARALMTLVPHSTDTEANRLVVAVAALGKWDAALPVLARLRPDIVVAIGQDFRVHPIGGAGNR